MIQNNQGKIYLIPTLLGETEPEKVLPSHIFETVNIIDVYIVENIRTARRFLRKINIKKPIDELTFFELNKRTDHTKLFEFIKPVFDGKNIGIISEAGCPGIADPGSDVVRLAHTKNIRIVPLVGPSSILLALIASGGNGQNFAFSGYLPIEQNERIKEIKYLESKAVKENQSRIFMETPYRNNKLLEDIFRICNPETMLTIATDITTQSEYIATKRIIDWKKAIPDLNKRPAIFVLSR